MHYVPIGLPFYLGLWLLIGLLVLLIQIGVIGYVFESMGVHRRYMFSLLALCLVGSYVNLPVAQFPAERMHTDEIVSFFGVQYVVPVVISPPGTVAGAAQDLAAEGARL
jgi:uncharacterized membrane protein